MYEATKVLSQGGWVVFMSTEGEGATVLYSKDITNSNLASETHPSSEYLAGFAVLKILQFVR